MKALAEQVKDIAAHCDVMDQVVSAGARDFFDNLFNVLLQPFEVAACQDFGDLALDLGFLNEFLLLQASFDFLFTRVERHPAQV